MVTSIIDGETEEGEKEEEEEEGREILEKDGLGRRGTYLRLRKY